MSYNYEGGQKAYLDLEASLTAPPRGIEHAYINPYSQCLHSTNCQHGL